MKILLTGASGFLGQNICRILQEHELLTLARTNAEMEVDLRRMVPIIPRVDMVIHAAGVAHKVITGQKAGRELYDSNLTITSNLLKALSSGTKPSYFVFISSVSVYGKETGCLLSEQTPLNATDPYGLSKIDSERIIQEWSANNGVTCTILRLPLLAGGNPPGNLRSMIKGINRGYYFNISGGDARKSIVLAEDVANIIPIAATIGGIYNLTDGDHPSFADLSAVIARQLGKPNPLHIPFWAAKLLAMFGDWIGSSAPIDSIRLKKITSDLTFDDSEARKFLGWSPLPVLGNFKI